MFKPLFRNIWLCVKYVNEFDGKVYMVNVLGVSIILGQETETQMIRVIMTSVYMNALMSYMPI
jgi:hypothetical protein